MCPEPRLVWEGRAGVPAPALAPVEGAGSGQAVPGPLPGPPPAPEAGMTPAAGAAAPADCADWAGRAAGRAVGCWGRIALADCVGSSGARLLLEGAEFNAAGAKAGRGDFC